MIYLIALWRLAIGFAVNGQEVLSKMSDHEKLLDKAVNIACCSKILNSTEEMPFLLFGLERPVSEGIFSPLVVS